MIWIGIVFGLGTALGHSLAYLATRWFTQDRGHSTAQLLVLSHTIMGVVSVGGVVALWPEHLGWGAAWVRPFAGLIACFVVAQTCLFLSLREADASRIAPLLGLKVALLAVISVLLGGALSAAQWSAVGLAVAAAWVLNGVGGRLPWRVTGLVVFACGFYAGADTLIVETIDQIKRISGDRSVMGVPLFMVAAVYTVVGLLGAALLPWFGTRRAAVWRDALPYAGCWLLAMVMLYATFAAVGTVLGAILQSTRGLMSIGLGIGLAAMGWHHLEQKHGPKVQVQRLTAAALMCAAVVLYVWGGS